MTEKETLNQAPAAIPYWRRGASPYLIAALGVGLATGLVLSTNLDANFANVSMLFVLVVTAAALSLGRLPAIFASLLSFLVCNWFFVEPRQTFAVLKPSELLSLCLFLFTATVTGQLIALLISRAELARVEARAQALAEADRLKTALLSMVSHDLRSPLTSIKASVSTLLADGVPCDAETQRELLQAVDQEADRLNRLVGNVLDLSRLEADAWRPRREATSIADLVGATLDSFKADDNSRIVVKLDRDNEDVYLDSVQIVQVLRNLLENALKYSPGEKSVELTARREAGLLIFQVADHGVGLPEGTEEQIFEPFYRAPQLQESSVPGVGIGLAVCRGLVEAHGGSVKAENRKGGGALFTISLPVGKEQLAR